jgi:hypothetical protein
LAKRMPPDRQQTFKPYASLGSIIHAGDVRFPVLPEARRGNEGRFNSERV